MIDINFSSDEHDDIAGNALTDSDKTTVRPDLFIRAGDFMAPGTLALRRLRELHPDRSIPLVYVAGNHDKYSDGNPKVPHLKTTIQRQLREMPEVAAELDIILLMDSAAELEINGVKVRLVGGTLWSDMQARPGWVGMNDAMRDAAKRMNDYRLIKVEPGRSRDMLTPRETIDMHRSTVRFIEETLATPTDADCTILVTHHAPSYRSLRGWDPEHPQRFGAMDWCYASDCERWFTGEGMGPNHVAPDIAFHGHVHANKDYVVGSTRILSNPRGYPLHALGMVGRENPDWDPNKIVTLEPKYTPTMEMR